MVNKGVVVMEKKNNTNNLFKVEKAKKMGLKAFITTLALAVTISGVATFRSCNHDHSHDNQPGIETEHEHTTETPVLKPDNSENLGDEGNQGNTEDETVEVIPEDPTHQHEWSDWEFYNDLEEIHVCNCGEKETRNHEYAEWINNNNGTESRVCNTCEYVQTRNIVHEHSFGDWESFSNTQEVRECECGEKEYRNHKLTNWVSVGNGTETRTCETCDYVETRDVSHTHNWSNWSYLNDDLEQRECECGEKETRKHILGREIFTYTMNNDGTHQVISTRNCNGCGTNIVVEKTETCEMGNWSFNPTTGLEESTCKNCGYTITRVHTHDAVPNNLVFGDASSNNDGTHNLYASYTCGTCNQEITLTKVKTCEYGAWINNNNGTESRSCGECGYTQTRDIAHTHSWGSWTYLTKELEQRECGCGETQTRSHTLGQSVVTYQTNNDGTHKEITTQHCSTCNTDISNTRNQSCEMGSWVYNRTTGLEEKKCSECGYTITREHTHDAVPSNLVYGNASSNDNGTHTLHASYRCSGCGETITLTKQENCEMSAWTYNKTTGLEERKCRCGYTETRAHTHDAAPSNLVYGNATTNNNGTHDLHASYKCSVCEETINLSKTVNCEYTNWVDHGTYHSHECTECGYTQRNEHYPNSSGIQVSQSSKKDVHNESYVCAECGITITREVACTSDKTTNIEVVDGVVLEYSNCTSCGGKCDQRSHTHSYSDWSYQDETYEVRSCSCGHGTEIRTHSYGELTYDESRQAFVQTCSGCGHEKVQAHTHSYGNARIEPSNSSDVCYYEVTTCSCGDEEIVPVGHDTYERTAFGRTYIFCHNCDLQIEKTNTLSVDENVYEEGMEQENIEDKPKTLSLIP